MRQEFFVVLLLLSCAYAFLRGGAPERIIGAVLLLGTLMSVLVVTPHQHFYHEEYGVFLVDVVALLIFGVVAFRSTRWWPLFVAGLQLDGVLVHLIHFVAPSTIPIAYLDATALWSYPMVLILATGTRRHRRREKRVGSDAAWKTSKLRPDGLIAREQH
jgi:hypothetical protein